MPSGSQYLNTQLGPLPSNAAVVGFVLSPVQANALAAILSMDAKDHFYSACASLTDAIRGVECGFYTWATVKCYYSLFYSIRSYLAMNGTCILNVRRSPSKVSQFWIDAIAGSILKTDSAKTHKLTLKLFANKHAGHVLLSNPIGGITATEWMIERREESNYGITRFIEPNVPPHFVQAQQHGARRLLRDYAADDQYLYAFQQDHAILAYPLKAIASVGSALKASGGVGIAQEEMEFIISECRDREGPITSFPSIIRNLLD